MAYTDKLIMASDGAGAGHVGLATMSSDQYFQLPATGGTSGAPMPLIGDFLANLANPRQDFTTTATAVISSINHCTSTSTNYALTLPAAASNTGKFLAVWIDGTSTYTVTVTGNASELIDGLNTRVMWAKEWALLYCDGTGWRKVAGQSIPMSGTLGNNGTNQTFSSGAATVLTSLQTSINVNAPTGFQTTATVRHTALRPGRYKVSAVIFVSANNTTACVVSTQIYKNGAVAGATSTYNSASTTVGAAYSEPFTLAAGDYIQIAGFYSAGSFTTTYMLDDHTTNVNNQFSLQEIITW